MAPSGQTASQKYGLSSPEVPGVGRTQGRTMQTQVGALGPEPLGGEKQTLVGYVCIVNCSH